MKLHITAPSGPVILVILSSKGDHVREGACGCVSHEEYVCVFIFMKLHINAQSGPVILVILCHLH